MSSRDDMSLIVNGKTYNVSVHPMKRLLDVIREDICLTGTKEGCGEGECGACTVILDGKIVMACLVPVCQASGKSISTIEGLTRKDELHPVQECFLDEGGAQCGICTPGMVIAAVAYANDPDSADDMREALAGNLCRCTGYTRIYESVKKALQKMGVIKESDKKIECV